MLTWDSVGFHNVAALESSDSIPGVVLMRYPAQVRTALSDRGQYLAQESTGSEIRFVTSASVTRLRVMALDAESEIFIFCGDFLHSVRRLTPGIITTLTLETVPRLTELPEPMRAACLCAPQVWRVMFNRAPVSYLGIDVGKHEVRPPNPDELPRLRYLAYGSSITHNQAYRGYSFQAARRLGADVTNLALSGSCRCEPEVADFIAGRDDWDFATLELGINMRGSFTAEEFADRAGYLVETITAQHPDKPVFLITIFPNWLSYGANAVEAEREQAYNKLLRTWAREKAEAGRNIYLLEGTDILNPVTGLTTDLLHPSEFGQVMMGENLARAIGPHLARE